jgi:hypothetical protein
MRLFLALLVAGLPSNLRAAPIVYVCDTDTNRQQTVFQDQIVIAHDAATGAVSVSDALILQENGGPLEGAVSSENNTRIVFTWTVRNVRNAGGQTATLNFRATLRKQDGRADFSMRPLGFDNSFQSSGTCAVQG